MQQPGDHMDRMNRYLSALILRSFIGHLATYDAAGETLDGFAIGSWNKMTCRPKVLRSSDTVRFRLPRKYSDEIIIFTPTNEFVTLADLFHGRISPPMKAGGSFAAKASSARDLTSKDQQPIFVQPGSYLIMVGRQFGTEAPIVWGWCRVTYRASGLTK